MMVQHQNGGGGGAEQLQLSFGVYVGEARDGKPHGQGEVNFRQDDNIVSPV